MREACREDKQRENGRITGALLSTLTPNPQPTTSLKPSNLNHTPSARALAALTLMPASATAS